MIVDVVSPEKTLWHGDAVSIIVPSADGALGILPGREPVLAILQPGKVRVTNEEGKVYELDVVGGFVSVDKDVEIIVDLGD